MPKHFFATPVMPKHYFWHSRHAKTLFLQLPLRQNTISGTPVMPKHCFCNSSNTKTVFLALPSRQNTVLQLLLCQNTISGTPIKPKHCFCNSRYAKTLNLVTAGHTWQHLVTTWQHLATTSGRYTDLKHSLYSGGTLPNLNFPPFFRPCVGRLGPFQKYA